MTTIQFFAIHIFASKEKALSYFEEHLVELANKAFSQMPYAETGERVIDAKMLDYGIWILVTNLNTGQTEDYNCHFDSKFYKKLIKIGKDYD